jgi:hypothetical protein
VPSRKIVNVTTTRGAVATLGSTVEASQLPLMRRARHASPAAALRYQHATEDRDKAIADAFDEMFRGDVLPIPKSNRSRPDRAQKAEGQPGDGL